MFAMAGRSSVVFKLNDVCMMFLLLGMLSLNAEANLNFHKRKVNYQAWAPDCVLVNIISINGEYPGRTIRARAGDAIVVQFKDLMPTKNVVIRWQGIRQSGTHYGLKQSVVFYGSLIVDATCKEAFTYNCQLRTHEQATGLSSRESIGEHQVDGITAARQNRVSDKNINKWSQVVERESFTMMGKGIITTEEEKRWSGPCKRVNTQGKLRIRRLLPKNPKINKGDGPHHNIASP
ncbi:L-ascorbate oxidase [Cryptomeria japonica]|uniref:L-ascorbate oxidase n=1 Tax=Cryptomeria japonica TaxID=3369 RepID=UPI0027DAB3F0|nr:L-ascorbate oxidase [Cryptomeria japonica]